jgi:hypothetical protein
MVIWYGTLPFVQPYVSYMNRLIMHILISLSVFDFFFLSYVIWYGSVFCENAALYCLVHRHLFPAGHGYYVNVDQVATTLCI